jgi:3D (Asp-Asp-Asp) domain-containing protein
MSLAKIQVVAVALLLMAGAVNAETTTAWVTVYNDHARPMADRHRVHVGAIAAPRWVRLGSRVHVQGLGWFTAEDRTNRRLDGRWDIWRPWSRERCYRWGKQRLRVTVLPKKT